MIFEAKRFVEFGDDAELSDRRTWKFETVLINARYIAWARTSTEVKDSGLVEIRMGDTNDLLTIEAQLSYVGHMMREAYQR